MLYSGCVDGDYAAAVFFDESKMICQTRIVVEDFY
jgi:hypothetical protein